MRFLISILILFAYSNTNGQNIAKEFPPFQDIYDNWKKHGSFQYANVKCDTFFYTDKIEEDLIEGAKNIFLEDSVIENSYSKTSSTKEQITLTKAERQFLVAELESLKQKGWEKNLFANSQLVKVESVEHLIKLTDQSKEILEKKLCRNFYSFSPPIFFRENLFCIFFSGETDVVMKQGECILYKKEGDNWIRYASLLRWLQ